MLKRAWITSDESIKTYQKKMWAEMKEKKTSSEKRKELKEKEIKMILTVKKIDKALADLNFDIGISMKSIYLGLTADNEDPLI